MSYLILKYSRIEYFYIYKTYIEICDLFMPHTNSISDSSNSGKTVRCCSVMSGMKTLSIFLLLLMHLTTGDLCCRAHLCADNEGGEYWNIDYGVLLCIISSPSGVWQSPDLDLVHSEF